MTSIEINASNREATDETACDKLLARGLGLCAIGQIEAGLDLMRNLAEQVYRDNAPMSASGQQRLTNLLAYHLHEAHEHDEVVWLAELIPHTATTPTATVHYIAAATLMESERPGEAIFHLRQCLEKAPLAETEARLDNIDSVAPRHMLANCLALAKKPMEAEREYITALAQDPKSVPLRYDYAEFLATQGRAGDAIETLHGALKEDRECVQLWRLGALITNAMIPDFAGDWISVALSNCPDDPMLVEQQGLAELQNPAA